MSLDVIGQEIKFAPIGSEWYYNFYDYGVQGYYHFETIKDTIVENKECQLLKGEFRYTNFIDNVIENYVMGDLILYQENDTVFFLRNETYHFLYDLNPEIGDIWEINQIPEFNLSCSGITTLKVKSISSKIYNEIDTVKSIVLGIDSTYLNDSIFTELYGDYGLDETSFDEEFIANWGGNNYMFFGTRCSPNVIDGESVNGLRCYKDNELSIIDASYLSCDYLPNLVGIDELENEEVKLIQQGTSRNFILSSSFEGDKNLDVLILDINGNLLIEKRMEGDEINIESIHPGIYIIILENKNFRKVEKVLIR